MKSVKCRKCKAEMKLAHSGNTESTEFRKNTRKNFTNRLYKDHEAHPGDHIGTRVRWTKVKKRSRYTMTFVCPVATCRQFFTIKRNSKAQALRRVNAMNRAFRHEIIRAGVLAREEEARKLEEENERTD
jgi:hypothetical protein